MDAAPIVEHIKKDVIDKVFKIKDTVAFHLTPERIGEFNGQSEVDEELGRKDIVEILKDISSSVAGLLSFSSEKKDDNAPKLQKDKEKDTGYVDFFKESLKDGKRPTTALYIKDNGVDDPEIDEAGADRSSLDPQLKLQKYFRQAFQYRMINSLEGTYAGGYTDRLDGLSFLGQGGYVIVFQ
jgi:hypothetical protein